MDDATATPVLYMRRVLRAPRERVFEAFVDPAQAARWFCPEGMTSVVEELDARPGGRYRIAMHGRDGAHTVAGEFREVTPPARLSMTWAWVGGEGPGPAPGPTSLVTFRFNDKGGETELTLTHEFPSQDAVGNHERGWTATLANLEAYLAG